MKYFKITCDTPYCGTEMTDYQKAEKARLFQKVLLLVLGNDKLNKNKIVICRHRKIATFKSEAIGIFYSVSKVKSVFLNQR